MGDLITKFLIALVLILILDFFWLGLIAKGIYEKEIGNFYKEKFNLYSALLLYILLAVGVVFIVLNNNFSTNLLSAMVVGAVFGLIVYGVYDLTNFAIIKNWPLKIVVIDMVWGTFLLGIVSFLTKYFSGFLK